MESFDYVIVGAGSAGSVLASRLSEDENATVCVLEAGPRDWHPFIHIPAGFMYTLVDRRVNWLYTSEPSEWTGGRRIAAPRGKTLGGSSSINGHIYNRGQRMDFDGWAQRGNRGWGYADVLPYFRRTERRIGEALEGDETFRGRDGSLPIADLDWRDPLCEAFIEGAVQMGIPRNRDYNGTMQAGVSYVQRVIEGGRRVSAARAFLHPAMKRRNLTVRTNAQASEIVLEGKRAVGVRYRKGGRNGAPVEVRASQGSDPVRRHGELATAPAGLGHRAGVASAIARHRGEASAGGRRREFARSLRAALRRTGEGRHPRSTSARRASPWSARC